MLIPHNFADQIAFYPGLPNLQADLEHHPASKSFKLSRKQVQEQTQRNQANDVHRRHSFRR